MSTDVFQALKAGTVDGRMVLDMELAYSSVSVERTAAAVLHA